MRNSRLELLHRFFKDNSEDYTPEALDSMIEEFGIVSMQRILSTYSREPYKNSKVHTLEYLKNCKREVREAQKLTA